MTSSETARAAGSLFAVVVLASAMAGCKREQTSDWRVASSVKFSSRLAAFAFSPESHDLLAVQDNGSAVLLDIDHGGIRIVGEFKGLPETYNAVSCPDGTFVLASQRGELFELKPSGHSFVHLTDVRLPGKPVSSATGINKLIWYFVDPSGTIELPQHAVCFDPSSQRIVKNMVLTTRAWVGRSARSRDNRYIWLAPAEGTTCIRMDPRSGASEPFKLPADPKAVSGATPGDSIRAESPCSDSDMCFGMASGLVTRISGSTGLPIWTRSTGKIGVNTIAESNGKLALATMEGNALTADGIVSLRSARDGELYASVPVNEALFECVFDRSTNTFLFGSDTGEVHETQVSGTDLQLRPVCDVRNGSVQGIFPLNGRVLIVGDGEVALLEKNPVRQAQ